MVTTTEAKEMLAARGVEVSYSNLALWVRSGRFAGAKLTDTPRGPVWMIPADAVAKFTPPARGWPKGKARKPEDAKQPAKKRGRKAA